MAEPIDPGVDIGHVHLKVSDLDRRKPNDLVLPARRWQAGAFTAWLKSDAKATPKSARGLRKRRAAAQDSMLNDVSGVTNFYAKG